MSFKYFHEGGFLGTETKNLVKYIMLLQKMPPDPPAFVKSIHWCNDSEEYPYSVGGSAFVVSFRGRLFLLSARHALSKEDEERSLEDVWVQARWGSQYRLGLGRGAVFIPHEETEGSVKNCDIQIHEVTENPNVKLTADDVLILKEPLDHIQRSPFFLVGFPSELQEIDHEKKESFQRCEVIGGRYQDNKNHPDDGMFWFEGAGLEGLDINGMSGGPVVSWSPADGWRLEGICVEGSGSSSCRRAGIVGRAYIGSQLQMVEEKISKEDQEAAE